MLLLFIEDRNRNRILTDYRNVNAPRVREVFMERMRQRYGDGVPLVLSQTDFQAFRTWVNNSNSDKSMAHAALRTFISGSRKRLAQVIGVIYPGGSVWSEDPRPIIDPIFPLTEIKGLLRELSTDELLDETETNNLSRMERLFDGGYPTMANPG